MTAGRCILSGAIVGALAVVLGAFGTHVLPGVLQGLGYAGDDLARRTDLYQTAVRYQMYHAPTLLMCGLLYARRPTSVILLSAWLYLSGVCVFSGLLYALALSGPAWRWLGAVVPIGGVLLIAGWLTLASAAWSFEPSSQDGIHLE